MTPMNHEGGGMVERIVLPSAIRRGQMATSPVWDVVDPASVRWRFRTRKEAAKFATVGCENHERNALFGCTGCGAHQVGPLDRRRLR